MHRVTYRKAGVDINKANKLVDKIKPLIAKTRRPGWVDNIGSFAGLFKPDFSKYKDPYIVASTDGVGTKLMIAQQMGMHYNVGIDLVAMSVNDLVTCGAEPLIFLDYYGTGKLKPKAMYDVLRGIVDGCKMANCALIGGETAELPGMYEDDIYDIAGFAVGIVDRPKIIDGRLVKEGDIILGIQSSGIHSNGYSLVRKVFAKDEFRGALGKDVLRPTIIYVRPVLDLMGQIKIKGIAHITGGGFFDNIIRAMSKNTVAVIHKREWEVPEIFDVIKTRGNISDHEMFRTFNMGIGMVLIISKEDAWKAKKVLLQKYKLNSWVIGEVIKGKQKVELIEA